VAGIANNTFALVDNAQPGGTSRASSPRIPSCHDPCFLLRCAPSGVQRPRRRRPVPRRVGAQGSAPVCPRAGSRTLARPVRPAVGQPGGDPAAPIGYRRASTPTSRGSARRSSPLSLTLRSDFGLGSRSCVALGGAAWPPAARNRGLAQKALGDEPPAERGHRCAPLATLVLLRLFASTLPPGLRSTAPPAVSLRPSVGSGWRRSWNTSAVPPSAPHSRPPFRSTVPTSRAAQRRLRSSGSRGAMRISATTARSSCRTGLPGVTRSLTRIHRACPSATAS
jgi:hypothetical protein